MSCTRAAWAEDLSEPARWLQGYLRIDTTNPPGGEELAADYLAGILLAEGVPVRRISTPEGRVSLYARLRASHAGDPSSGASRSAPGEAGRGGSGGGAIVLTHHMDVVPPGPGWSVEPFSGELRDGRLWGRGALDTKGLGVAHLAAFLDLARSGVPLTRDVIFLAVPDEETGGERGMAWLFEAHPQLFAGVEAVFNEGGASRVAATGLLWWEVEVAQKRPLWLRLRTRGWGGHGSSHIPESAVHLMIEGLDRLLALPRPYRVTPVVRSYFEAIAPLHRGEQYRRMYSDIDAVIEPEGPTETILPGLHRLFVDTVQVTVVRGSESINVIGEEAVAEVDIRLLPDTDDGAFLAVVREALGPDVEVEVLLTVPPAEPSPTSGAAWEAIAEVFGEEAPVVPSLSSGFTDSRHFRSRGIAAYGVTPFALNGLEAAGIHAADEALGVAELERGAERMSRIVRLLAAPSASRSAAR